MNLKDVLLDEIFTLNQENIEELKKNLENKRASWAFCLGAGVSISCGLPDWSKLLAMINGKLLNSYSNLLVLQNKLLKIMSETIRNTAKNSGFADKLNGAAQGDATGMYRGIDSLEMAEYIRTMVKEQLQIGNEEALIDEALCEYIQDCYNVQWESDGKIKGYDNSTLHAVIEVMKSKNIRRAITYNYDDLLEISLKRDNKKVESIVPGDQREFVEDDNTFKIYHCHGLVPVKDSAGTKSVYSSKIILTETSYYNEESSNYSLANVLQAYSMNYCNLLYVGFSGADYTFRRIVRGINREENKIKHYIFFCVDDIVKMVYEGIDKKLSQDDFISKLKEKEFDYERLVINQMVVSKTLYWEEKGMNVIWSTWEELPKVLMDM